jgi:SNF2 family DNA or RNA helicase
VSAFRDRLRTLAVSAQPELPAAFGTELRPYQKSGLAWLQFLHALVTG